MPLFTSPNHDQLLVTIRRSVGSDSLFVPCQLSAQQLPDHWISLSRSQLGPALWSCRGSLLPIRAFVGGVESFPGLRYPEMTWLSLIPCCFQTLDWNRLNRWEWRHHIRRLVVRQDTLESNLWRQLGSNLKPGSMQPTRKNLSSIRFEQTKKERNSEPTRQPWLACYLG